MVIGSKKVSIHSGHRQRLKKRFSLDPQQTEDYEVLEILLGYGITRKDTKPLAKELLMRFGTLRNVLDARKEELESVPGFGSGLWIFWQVLRECMARYAVAPLLEECWVALVDAGNRCMGWERLCKGGIDGVNITPRDVLAKAFERKAHGFILVHNHPGGNTKPSRADLVISEELRRLAPQMNIRFIEHIIVTENECCSILLNQYF